VRTPLQNERDTFYPRSPYGVAKLYAYWIVINYREAYNIFATTAFCSIMNLPPGENFVTRKITMAAAHIKHGRQHVLTLAI